MRTVRSSGRRRAVWGTALAAAGLLVSAPQVEGAEDPPRPNANEQYQIEVLNRTRANPAGEAARHGIDLNEGLPNGTLGPEAREPLAVNFHLIAAARAHNKDLFAKFSQLPGDHRGSDGRDPTQRGADAGADFIGGVAENNAWTSQSGTGITEASVNALHALLFKDFTSSFEVVGRGHRKVMLNGARDEVGVAVGGGVFGGRQAAIVTQDYVTTDRTHLLGVVFVDTVTQNDFYTPGEGLKNVRIVATRQGSGDTYETATWGSGGWQVEVPPGTYDVRASGGGLPSVQERLGVVVGSANVKVDFRTLRTVPVPKPQSFSTPAATAKLSGSGTWSLAIPRAALFVGAFTLPETDVDAISVEVDGVTFFAPGDRAASTVVKKLDPKSGEVLRFTVKDAAKNVLSLNVKTGALKLLLKSAPGVDPTDGPVRIAVVTPFGEAFVEAATKAVGTSGQKVRLAKTVGDWVH